MRVLFSIIVGWLAVAVPTGLLTGRWLARISRSTRPVRVYSIGALRPGPSPVRYAPVARLADGRIVTPDS
jgi:hypothetical protein